MNRELIITMRELINKYGSEIYTDSRKLKSFLNDYYPDKYVREKRLIIDSVEQKIPEDIISNKETKIDDFLYNKLAKKLYDNLGISGDLSEETIDTWCEIFNKTHIKVMNHSLNNSSNISNSFNASNNSHSNNLSNANNFSGNPTSMNNGGLPNNMYYGQSRPGNAASYNQQNCSMNTVLMNNAPVNNAPIRNKKSKKTIIGMPLLILAVIIIVAYSMRDNKDSSNKKLTNSTGITNQVNSNQDNTYAKDDNRQIKSNNFICPESSTTKIQLYKLYNLSSDQLYIARNEIFARHGYIFKDKKLQEYFEAQAWYKPNPDAKGETTDPVEKDNVETIRDMEEIKLDFKNSPQINRDFVFNYSDVTKLTPDEVERLSDLEILIARNEIFARHGYIFGVPELNDYFQSKSWYTKNSNNVTLNDVEEYNAELIKRIEEKRVYNMIYNYELGSSY